MRNPTILLRWTLLPTLLALFSQAAVALTVATNGCPLFHCNIEATGVVSESFIDSVQVSNVNSSLGTLVRQGCSGNGTALACLYQTDKARGMARGTLKKLNATTLQPLWGSAAAGSYNLDAPSASEGQVPVNFSNGSIAAGDAYYEVLYSASGAVLGKVPLDGVGKNLGLTPLSATYGVVSQTDGLLTLIDLTTWTAAGTLTLTDPTTAAAVTLIAVSTGASNALYAIGNDPGNNAGILYSIALGVRTHRLSLHSTFTFVGSSGACPVVVTAALSGLPATLVLLAVPGLVGDAQPQNRLVALSDSATTGLGMSWVLPLDFALTVSPTVDPVSGSVFYQGVSSPDIFQASLYTGDSIQTFDLQAAGGFPGTFVLNGHLVASQADSTFTLLLSGESTGGPSGTTEYAMTYQPLAAPDAVIWASPIATTQVNYTAAWNFAPSNEARVVCPIAITADASASAIVRLCDH